MGGEVTQAVTPRLDATFRKVVENRLILHHSTGVCTFMPKATETSQHRLLCGALRRRQSTPRKVKVLSSLQPPPADRLPKGIGWTRYRILFCVLSNAWQVWGVMPLGRGVCCDDCLAYH